MSKNLVAYFSASGVTARIAKKLSDAAGADLYEIKPATPYTTADLDWRDKNSRSTIEMNDPASRPVIEGGVPDMSGYDKVFIGFPIWWYTAPTIIKTFLEACKFSGQKIALFATSGGSGFGDTKKALAPCCPNAAIKGEKLLNSSLSLEALRQWAETI